MTDLPALLNPNRKFEHLPRAPIAEAVIEARARADSTWDETVEPRLKAALPDYPNFRPIHSFSMSAQFAFAPPGVVPPAVTPPEQHDLGWIGVRSESGDGQQIGVFTRDSFSFSRLTPYEDWGRFSGEALRLWELHASLGKPAEIQRLGVRFINRFDVPMGSGGLQKYFSGLPTPVLPLPTVGFVHQHTMAVPNQPFAVSVTRMLEPPEERAQTAHLVVDIDVFSAGPLLADTAKIQERLGVMRILKNVAFFGSLTDDALELFR